VPREPAIAVQSLTKRYDARAVVDGISFDVQPGECFALLGPNGAGKTTTVEILEGYRRPDGGTVRVLGLDPARDRERLMRRAGVMLQSGGVYPQLTPREALRLFAAFYPDPRDPEELLALVQLESVARSRVRHLSGGEKQRLSLALALIGRPELLFLDEPTASMDPAARRATWSMLRELRERGATILLTTHFIEEAERLADRVAVMSAGKLVALDAPDALRHAADRRIRIKTRPGVAAAAVATSLRLSLESVRDDGDGVLTIDAEPTPQLVATLTAWLATEGALLASLTIGAGTLEDAYLALTSEAATAAQEVRAP
jgi:ABC-2 type transport system ATP-binding protein